MFQDVKMNGVNSKYKDWFHIHQFPITTDPLSYATFSFEPSMPKLNTSNPETQNYLISVATYWIKEFDIDGWRLDVSNEIDFKFWRLFCSAARAVKPDIYILGELWHNSLNWISSDKFDSAMNYPLLFALINCIAKKGAITTFQHTIDHVRHWYPEPVNQVLFNLVSSHDIARILTKCKNDVSLSCICYAFLFTYLGTPCIYYGDEIGLDGEQDPDNRKCMEWDKSKYNYFIYNSLQKLIRIRKQHKVLCTGLFKWIHHSDTENYFLFKRYNTTECIIIIFHLASDKPLQLDLTKFEPIPPYTIGYDLYTDLEMDLTKILLKKKSFSIIKLERIIRK
jgi:glycosidase